MKLKMKRLNIHIPEELHKTIKTEATSRKISMTKYMLQALVEKAQREQI